MTSETVRQVEELPPELASLADEYYIPAKTSLIERRSRTLKHGDTFGVFDRYGDIVSVDGSPDGLYHQDTRYLSDFRISVNGRRPLLLSSVVMDNNALFAVDLSNPDFEIDGHYVLPRDTIHIVRTKFLWNSACYERFGLRNFDNKGHRIELGVRCAADFADIFEVRGHSRCKRGKSAIEVFSDRIVFTYHGLDGIVRRTVVSFSRRPDRIGRRGASFILEMPANSRSSLFSTVVCEQGVEERPPQRFFGSLKQARRALHTSTSRAASVETSNEILNEVLSRSVSDLYMLLTDTEHGPYPYAGIPWFSTAFGRDAIVTAIETLWIDPSIARGVLKLLAATQATESRAEADSEPGKILHEMRAGEMARLGEVPFALYYGSVDSTPLFVMLAGLYYERTGDLATVSALWPNIEAALAWIDGKGDANRDGFLEYARSSDTGLVNQGWKDSVDSVFHSDGTCAEEPIALCEVQGYVFAARKQAAAIADAMGMPDRAQELRRQAERLRVAFEDAFWCEEIGTYALALDGHGRPCKVRSSNAGQLLFCGIVTAERAKKVADGLMGHAFFTGWGIRTIASSEALYNPMSYHNGSVWPHDNALIGLGFARYGLKQHLLRLFTGMFDTAVYMDLRRLPELFCGFRRAPGKGPTFYPVACSPQAWSCAAPFCLLQACFGLEICFASGDVRFRQPRLPRFLEQVTIRSLAVGDSRLDILLRRYGSDVSVNVLRRDGIARIAVTL